MQTRTAGTGGRTMLDWMPVLAGLAVLFAPTFYGLSEWVWRQEEHAHGPIILLVAAWLFWRSREALEPGQGAPARAVGVAVIVFALLVYMLGRSLDITLLEVGSLAPLLAGSVLAMRGYRALRRVWFPIAFVIFMVPIPGILVDAATAPLKSAVSQLAVDLLYPAGYPIAREGVVLTVGRYQLLVADACSGLNSMFSLSALGLLFMHLTARPSLLHNAVMLAAILPIAFAANIIRVIALILITYHFGDAAGQGFLHGSAGMVLVLAALAFLLGLDAVLARMVGRASAP